MTSTSRIYENIQTDFADWCINRRIRAANHMIIVTAYLHECMTTRGPSSVIVRASAIAKLYRDRGQAFDTKFQPLQDILSIARRSIEKNRRSGRKKG